MTQPTSLEQAKDLLEKLCAARKALENTGFAVARGESLAPLEYQESEVSGRYEGVWWMLSIAINDARALKDDWKESEPAP